MGEHDGKKLLPSVSTSLALAASIGLAEAVALSFGSGFLMNIMGIPVVRRLDLIMNLIVNALFVTKRFYHL